MDVSTIFWDFVNLLSNEAYEDVKNSELFQKFQFASYMNRQFILKEDVLVDSSKITCCYPRGISYEHHSACYCFDNFKCLMFGTAELLRNATDLKSNATAFDRYNKIVLAISKLEREHFDIINAVTSRRFKMYV